MSQPTQAQPPRRRLTADERRRQFLGIGLRAFVERPMAEVSLEDVAREAGVSSGLLFHYFPTKTDFHRAVVEAAARRVLRTVAPDAGATGAAAVRQVVGRFVEQIRRRRDSYVALVFGQSPVTTAVSEGEAAQTLRQGLTGLVLSASALDPALRPVVHGWVAYVEDRALAWSAEPHPGDSGPLVEHCVRALEALVATG